MKLKPLGLTGALVLIAASGARAETLSEAGVSYESGCRELNVYFERNNQLSYQEQAQNTYSMLMWLRSAGMQSVRQTDAEISLPMITNECRQHPEETIRQVVAPIVIGAMEFRLGAGQ